MCQILFSKVTFFDTKVLFYISCRPRQTWPAEVGDFSCVILCSVKFNFKNAGDRVRRGLQSCKVNLVSVFQVKIGYRGRFFV